MANLYENIPEMQARAQANEQRRKIAESLLVQSQDQVQPFVSTGRMVAPMSITQGLAQMLKAYYAGKGIKSANEGDKALATEFESKRQAAIDAYTKAMTGSQGSPGVAPLPIAGKEAAGPPVNSVPATLPANEQGRDAAALALAGNRYVDPLMAQTTLAGRTWARQDAGDAADRLLKKETEAERIRKEEAIAKQRSEDFIYKVDSDAETRRVIAQSAAANRPEKNAQIVQTDQGIMQFVDGKLVPVMDASGTKPARAPAAANFDRSYAARLRGEYNTRPEVKEANDWDSRMPSVATHYLHRNEATDAQKAVGDNELVKAYISATRAEGTRESNLSTSEIAKLPGLPSRVQAAIANFALGKHLPDEIATELYKAVSSKRKALAEQRKAARSDVISRANLAGIDEGLLFEDTDGR